MPAALSRRSSARLAGVFPAHVCVPHCSTVSLGVHAAVDYRCNLQNAGSLSANMEEINKRIWHVLFLLSVRSMTRNKVTLLIWMSRSVNNRARATKMDAHFEHGNR